MLASYDEMRKKVIIDKLLSELEESPKVLGSLEKRFADSLKNGKVKKSIALWLISRDAKRELAKIKRNLKISEKQYSLVYYNFDFLKNDFEAFIEKIARDVKI